MQSAQRDEEEAGSWVSPPSRYWPNLTHLLQHVDRTWNVDGTGMLSGIQPSTHDIDLTGHNPFMGTLWLAALRAAEQMALLLDDADAAAAYRATFVRASASYDAALFTGEYYVQRLLPGDNPDYPVGGRMSGRPVDRPVVGAPAGPRLPVTR